jgi:hypothetical protein
LGVDPTKEVTSEEEAAALLGAVRLSPEQDQNIQEAINYVLEAPMIKGTKGEEEVIEIEVD